MRSATVVVAAVLLVGLAGAIVAWSDRGPNGGFVRAQKDLGDVNPGQLAAIMATTRDPRRGSGEARARTATCVPHGRGALQNPWSCAVRYAPSRHYPTRPVVTYRIIIASTGAVTGVTAGGIKIDTCCVETRFGS